MGGGRYPHPVLTGVWGTPIQSQWGWVPPPVGQMGVPPSGRMVYPTHQEEWGYGTSLSARMGYFPFWKKGSNSPPPPFLSATWGNPPAGANRLKTLPSLILRMRAVITCFSLFSYNIELLQKAINTVDFYTHISTFQ